MHLKIIVPKHLSEKQRILVESYARLEEGTPGTIKGVSDKVVGKATGNNFSSACLSMLFRREFIFTFLYRFSNIRTGRKNWMNMILKISK